MSYIQSVYDRLLDHVIERNMQDWEVDFDRDKMFLEIHFPLSGYNRAYWEITFFECSFYVTPLCTNSNYLGDDIIAIGELVNAMNAIAHKDFMEALSESESLDGQD